MSRAYQYQVKVTGADKSFVHKLLKKMEVQAEDYSHNGIIIIEGDTSLSGGEGEEEAHARISKAIKAKYPKAKVKTIWTYLEDLPFKEYGDEVEL